MQRMLELCRPTPPFPHTPVAPTLGATPRPQGDSGARDAAAVARHINRGADSCDDIRACHEDLRAGYSRLEYQ